MSFLLDCPREEGNVYRVYVCPFHEHALQPGLLDGFWHAKCNLIRHNFVSYIYLNSYKVKMLVLLCVL